MKLFYHTRLSQGAARLQNIARYLGIVSEAIDVCDIDSLTQRLVFEEEPCVVFDIESLGEKLNDRGLKRLAMQIVERSAVVLLPVFAPGQSVDRVVRALTHNAVQGITSGTAERAHFPSDSVAFSRELSSYSFMRDDDQALTLKTSSGRSMDRIMLLDQSPSFVRLQIGAASIFIWSTTKIFDLDQPLAAEREFEDAADQYVPAIIFLRFAFGERCWHNSNPGAGLVIDDPLLTKHYGFINFPQLLESAKTREYHVTLAFIPWNHWRSRPTQVELFRRYSDCFSICTHGCDHSNKEFKSTDYDELLSKNFVASQRMRRHAERTGLECEPLMVCPQEEYSLQAMRAFADSRQFIGLVCTSCIPRDLPSSQISGADLLLPAQDSFFGFPVFKRHYWKGDLSAFAMALFLGKHAILVEHHEFFRNGSGNMENFAEELAELRPKIKWKSLVETATGTHLIRHSSENQREVRFFTDTFKFEHKPEKPLEYRFIRRMPESAPIRHVLVNGVPIEARREQGFLTFEAQFAEPQTLRIQVEIVPKGPTKLYSFGIKYHASVACRRFLSELRDNVLVHNELALRTGRFLARTLRQTSN